MKDIWKRKERIERERGGDMLSSINYKGKKSCTFEWPRVPTYYILFKNVRKLIARMTK
jgi:hypothetical protein